MSKLFTTSAIIASLIFLHATSSIAQTNYSAIRSITLKFKGTEGTNGCAVVWNPDKKLYYAVIAGNEVYPLETFSESGKNVSELTAMIDTRGLWYNAKSKKLEGNGPGETGYFYREMESSGIPGQSVTTFSKGQHQPDFNSVGAFDSKKQMVYFYLDGTIYTYKRKNGAASKTIYINAPVSVSNLNASTVIFTGRKGEELGLLDKEEGKVYFFDLKGNHTASVTLPSGSETPDMFRFSFANGKIWVYDVGTRSWTGCSF